jgi:hypothetical protein
MVHAELSRHAAQAAKPRGIPGGIPEKLPATADFASHQAGFRSNFMRYPRFRDEMAADVQQNPESSFVFYRQRRPKVIVP